MSDPKTQSKMKSLYDEYWSKRLAIEDSSRAAQIRFTSIFQLVTNPPIRVLDVGCGDGTTLTMLKKSFKNSEYYGLDISDPAIESAKAKGINAISQDVESTFPFPDNYFDLVICTENIEHLIFPEKCLLEINRVLNKKGAVIISIPNLAFINKRVRLLFGLSPIEKGKISESEHLHFWTYPSFCELLNSTSFNVEKIIGLKRGKIQLAYKFPKIFSECIFFKATKKLDA